MLHKLLQEHNPIARQQQRSLSALQELSYLASKLGSKHDQSRGLALIREVQDSIHTLVALFGTRTEQLIAADEEIKEIRKVRRHARFDMTIRASRMHACAL